MSKLRTKKLTAMERTSDMDAGADRISQLPEPILQHILSFLLAKDVARISTLSKGLASAWNSHPYLNFGHILIFCESKDIPNIVNVVDQTLANRQKQKINIQKFCIWLPDSHWMSYIEKRIDVLRDCNIEELKLRVINHIDEDKLKYHRLPESIFDAKTLNVLSLGGFKIELPSNGIKFSSLREFYLSCVFLDDQFIEALCTSCCNLEVLSLQSCHGLHNFQVCDTLHKLKTVELDILSRQFNMIDIVSTNLEDLKIKPIVGAHLKLVKITACKALKKLELDGVCVTNELLEELFASLPELEIFSLIRCETLKTMKIASDSLEWLTVSKCRNLIAVELDTPNLTKFRYDDHILLTSKTESSRFANPYVTDTELKLKITTSKRMNKSVTTRRFCRQISSLVYLNK